MCLGIPGRIIDVHDPEHCMAMVEISGVRRAVNIACIVDAEHPPQACLGEWVLVHVGFAMSRLDEAEAAKTLELLTMMGEVQAELEALRS
jgi:hydrogenase expression/formation protein HypC